MTPSRMSEVREGVERLVRNIAIQDRISIERAAYLVRSITAANMSKKPPTPTPTPTGDPEVRTGT